MIGILFVCLGNICRSPMAEGVFRQLVTDDGVPHHFRIDSAGTSRYHLGESPHPGTRRILSQHGITYTGRARQVSPVDLNEFDYLIAMDADNLAELQLMLRSSGGPELHRLLDFAADAGVTNVPDPYYTGDFERTYQLVLDGCQGLLAHIRQHHQLNA